MNGKVEIKVVEKNGNGTFNGFVRYPNTSDTISPYFDGTTGILYTGLTEEDEKYFGGKLQKDLSKESSFWDDFKIVLKPKGITLELTNITHQLQYKFLQNHYRIAQSLTDPGIGIKDYYIVDDNKEAELVNNKAQLKIKANGLFSKLSVENKKDILKLYPNYTNMDTVSTTIIDAKLYEELEKNPAKFISHAEDKKRDLKVLLKDLISAELLRKNKSSYYYGEDFLGHDEESTIEYLEHPDRQGLKIDLLKQLEVKGKKK